jgi:hypothetical protein
MLGLVYEGSYECKTAVPIDRARAAALEDRGCDVGCASSCMRRAAILWSDASVFDPGPALRYEARACSLGSEEACTRVVRGCAGSAPPPQCASLAVDAGAPL